MNDGKGREGEFVSPTSEGAAVYVDFSKTRETHSQVKRHFRLGFFSLWRLKTKKAPLPFGYFIALLLAVIAVFLLMLVYLKGYRAFTRTHVDAEVQVMQSESNTCVVVVEQGMSAMQAACVLEAEGVVASAAELLSYLVSEGLETSVQSGTYLFEKGCDILLVAKRITQPKAQVPCVVQPGWTLRQVDGYLVQRGYAREGEFLRSCSRLVSAYGLSFEEGWFLSGSYASQDPFALAQAMYQGTIEAFYPYLDGEVVHAWGIEGVLIVASMVQAETQDVAQMRLIAGIIYNRIRSQMPLGIDATTRYELGDWINPIPEEVWVRDTPYNTRRKKGLPPSGICCPSKEAVEAACTPLGTDALYYLHGKDGKIHTATDYEGHKRNIALYL